MDPKEQWTGTDQVQEGNYTHISVQAEFGNKKAWIFAHFEIVF